MPTLLDQARIQSLAILGSMYWCACCLPGPASQPLRDSTRREAGGQPLATIGPPRVVSRQHGHRIDFTKNGTSEHWMCNHHGVSSFASCFSLVSNLLLVYHCLQWCYRVLPMIDQTCVPLHVLFARIRYMILLRKLLHHSFDVQQVYWSRFQGSSLLRHVIFT